MTEEKLIRNFFFFLNISLTYFCFYFNYDNIKQYKLNEIYVLPKLCFKILRNLRPNGCLQKHSELFPFGKWIEL